MTRARLRRIISASTLVAASACGSNAATVGSDAGVGLDARSSLDAGHHDARVREDASGSKDGGEAHDAGHSLDAGHPVEAGSIDAANNESGQGGDAGVDAAQTADAARESGIPRPDASEAGGDAGAASTLHVASNTLVDHGKTVRLLGIDRSGTEYSCIQGNGDFDGPVDQAAITSMLAWHVNAVRVPLNEDCWLAINGAPAAYSGSAYRAAIAGYVTLLRQNGLYVILDLHWNDGGTTKATGQQEMADSDHAPDFWTGVASTFKSDLGVVFDLYNEPHDISWSCWLSGGCQASGWTVAGMQQLLDAVRATGSKNVVMAGGLGYASDLSAWLANKPSDPTGNLAASFHLYNFGGCNAVACWSSQIGAVAAVAPVITGELGENDCAHGFIDGYMAWADSNAVSYLGWAWNADFNCNSGPGLISDWSGTPTVFGSGLQAHLAMVNP